MFTMIQLWALVVVRARWLVSLWNDQPDEIALKADYDQTWESAGYSTMRGEIIQACCDFSRVVAEWMQSPVVKIVAGNVSIDGKKVGTLKKIKEWNMFEINVPSLGLCFRYDERDDAIAMLLSQVWS